VYGRCLMRVLLMYEQKIRLLVCYIPVTELYCSSTNLFRIPLGPAERVSKKGCIISEL
jgi:hypothetical protein